MNIEFCLPVYNEEKILRNNAVKLLNYCLSQKFKFNWKIVLIINGSNDNSAVIGRELSKDYPEKIKLFVIKKVGKGNALKTYCAGSQSDIILYMDIDLAVSFDNIYNLISLILNKDYDLVIGSRMLPASRIRRSFLRELSSQGYNFLARMILGNKFSDLQCGFKAVKTSIFKKIVPNIKDGEWFFDTELVVFADFFKYKIEEAPVDWEENRYDERKSKINVFKNSLKFVFYLFKLRVRLKNKKPLA